MTGCTIAVVSEVEKLSATRIPPEGASDAFLPTG